MNAFGITALMLFFGVFVIISVRAFLPGARDEQQRAGALPLDDGDQP